MYKHLLLTFFLFLSITHIAQAQSSNDECSGAIDISQVIDFCSEKEAFNNAGASLSDVEPPGCFPSGEDFRDVWFRFTAIASDVNIRVIGATSLNAGGTLRSPQLAIYSGLCSDLTELQCISDNANNHVVQTFENELIIGETYYIRVSARSLNTGTFQLCINNFNAIPSASSDCSTGVVLCDKSPFTVDFVNNFGAVRDDIPGVFCAGLFPVIEEQSTWFKWTCEQAGSLTFTITPLNPDDDIDWALYELPSGINGCSNKDLLRFNISGEIVGAPLSDWQACTGSTGLREGDDDEGEDCGCDPTDDNFSRSVDMVEGRVYALVIINYSMSGFGYNLSFGGTGTFKGPEANFIVDPSIDGLCVGEPIRFTDASSFAGGLTDWAWNFGPTARTTNTIGEGPHEIIFDRPGTKSVLLRVTSVDGCVVSRVGTIEIECCENHFSGSGSVTNLLCPDQPLGAIDFSISSNYPVESYTWSNGDSTQDISSLLNGTYSVQVIDEATCDSTFTFLIDAPDSFALNADIIMPTCNGGTDGAVTLFGTGATPPYQFSFNGGNFGNTTQFSNLSVGDYTISVTDANNCNFDTILTVSELELQLDPFVDAITPPTCNGFSNGAIQVIISNGEGPYQFNFNDGRGFQNDNSLLNISSGTFEVNVLDQNLCEGSFMFSVEDFATIGADIAQDNVSCFGLIDGSLLVDATGGTGVYTYSWTDGSNNPDRLDLPAGTYTLQISDDNNCTFDTILQITQPPEILIQDIDISDAICFGDSNAQVQLLGEGGSPPYQYAINNGSLQNDNLFLGLRAGSYVVRIEDVEGCSITDTITVNQPDQLMVDAGNDQIIRLGEEADLRAIASLLPVTYNWTPLEILSCSDCSSPIAFPLETTIFQITIEDLTGCIATDEVKVSVAKFRDLYAPNVFSPNGDGDNDFFTLYGGPSVERIEKLQIFDRWGNLIYLGNDLPPGSEGEVLGWDGTHKGQELSPAVFTYVANVRFIDQDVVLFKGDVTLMR